MTLDEFFEELATIKDRALPVLPDSTIRLKCGCPIVALANNLIVGAQYDDEQWLDAAGSLGLDRDDAEAIVEAADGIPGEMRIRLLNTLEIE